MIELINSTDHPRPKRHKKKKCFNHSNQAVFNMPFLKETLPINLLRIRRISKHRFLAFFQKI